MDAFALPSRVALSDQNDFALTALQFGGDAMWIWRTARWSLRRWRRIARMQRSLLGVDPDEIRKAERQADREAVQRATGREKLRSGLDVINKALPSVRAIRAASVLVETPAVGAQLVEFQLDRFWTVAQAKTKLLADLAVYAVLVDGQRRRISPEELQLAFEEQSLETDPDQEHAVGKSENIVDFIAKRGVANAAVLAELESALAKYLVQLYTDD